MDKLHRNSEHLVAILFTDMVASSEYYSKRGNTAAAALVQEHDALLSPIVKAAGGRIVKKIGDSIFATFVDPAMAVRCAWTMQQALAQRNSGKREGEHISVRIGVHYGLVLEIEKDMYSDAVNMTARLESLAQGGQVLVSRTLRDLLHTDPLIRTRSLGPAELKGSDEPMEIFELLSAPVLLRQGARWPGQSPRAVGAIVIAALILAGTGAAWWATHRSNFGAKQLPKPQSSIRPVAKLMLRRWDPQKRETELSPDQRAVLPGDQFQLVYHALESHYLYAAYFDSQKHSYQLVFPTPDALEPVALSSETVIPKGDLHFAVDKEATGQSLLFIVASSRLRLLEDPGIGSSASALKTMLENIRDIDAPTCDWKPDSAPWTTLQCASDAKVAWIELPIGPH